MNGLDALADRLRRLTVEVRSGDRVLGAGVVCGGDWIVTNAHVVRQPRVVVRLADGRCAEALVAAGDRGADLAVLRVPRLDLPEAMAAAGEPPPVGSLVVAVGHPFGRPGALTIGIVHAVGPLVSGGRPWIQADLRLAPGNSGGPLADARGRLVGVNAMLAGSLALAIPVSEVRRFVRVAGAPDG